jgi:GxxExxY protein
MTQILYREESYQILGACFEVYKEKGCGFNEAVFQECLAIEFGLRAIPFAEQVEVPINYKNRALKSRFKADFICYDKIIVELKAVSALVDEHRAQVLNYLYASGKELGLLVNFGRHPKVEYERFAATEKSFRASSRFSRANNSLEEVEL